MASTFLTVLAGALVLVCFWLYRTYTFWKRNGIPNAKGVLPFLGNMLPVLTVRVQFGEMITKLYKKYDGLSMFGFYKVTQPVLVVRDPKLVKEVLQTNFTSFHENTAKVIKEIDPLLALNPFFCYGEDWVTGRKRITYAFSNVRLKILFTAVNGVCKKFQNFLDQRLKSQNEYEVELKYLLSKFTGETVANAGFGIEGLCFEDKEYPTAFDAMGKEIFGTSLFQGLLQIVSLFIPQLQSILRMPFIPKHVDAFFRHIVSQNLELRRKDPVPRNDFLQLMIDLEKEEGKKHEEVITAHALSFFVDGLETSSITLTFVVYQLAVHPYIQENVRNEVKEKIAKYGTDLSYEALKEMTYMEQVISESQRCYPAVGFITKLCTNEIELRGSDGLSHRLKPGDEVIIPINGLQHDPKYWTDPDTFDPERFNEERKHSINKITFIPFGEGPRMCVGMRMAMLQMKACLAALVNNYKIELSSKTNVPLKLLRTGFLSQAEGGIWVRVSKL